MMKSLFRRSATLGLIGSTLLASWLGGNFQALALPEQQVLDKLQPVPVFAITDDKGNLLVGVIDNDKKVTEVYISRQDAEVFLEQLKKDKPDVAKNMTVKPISLGQAYKLQTEQKQENGLIVSYVPQNSEVESAKQILSTSGQEYQGGVPLFVAKAGEDQGYLMITQNNQPVIPMFFEKATAIAMAEEFKKQNPKLASTVKIDVIPLEGVMQVLQQSDDQNWNKIVLIPSKDTLDYIRTNLPKQPTEPQQKK